MSCYGLCLIVSACSAPWFSPAEYTGLAARDAHELRHSIAQTLKRTSPKTQKSSAWWASQDPQQRPPAELTLRGRGEIHGAVAKPAGMPVRIALALYLEKEHYAEGYAEIRKNLSAQRGERWPILAYALQGESNERFAFLYLLHAPDGRVHYLHLVGGWQEMRGKRHLRIEGSLIAPGAAHDLKRWRYRYRFIFAAGLADPPPVEALVTEAGAVLERLREQLERIAEAERKRISEAKERAAEKEAPPIKPSRPSRPELAQREAAAQLLRTYYPLRMRIAREYAALLESNLYLWAAAEGREGYHERWKRLLAQQQLAAALWKRLAPFLSEAQHHALRKFREHSLAQIQKQRIQARFLAGSGG